MPTTGLSWLLRHQCLLQCSAFVGPLRLGCCSTRASGGYHSAAEAGSPLPNPDAQLCGKRDARTKRGKIFRGSYRELLPRQFNQAFPGGPIGGQLGSGRHGGAQERFRYPTPPGSSGASGAVGSSSSGRPL